MLQKEYPTLLWTSLMSRLNSRSMREYFLASMRIEIRFLDGCLKSSKGLRSRTKCCDHQSWGQKQRDHQSLATTQKAPRLTHNIPEVSNCAAQTPPPFCAKPSPKLFGAVSLIAHPFPCEQSVVRNLPVCEEFPGTAKPGLAWREYSLLGIRLTPSMMSISPWEGHSVP